MTIQEYLKKRPLLTDGAMGTYYGEKYGRPGENPEPCNLTHPERIVEIHKEYLEAGVGLLRTNSFSSNLTGLFGFSPEEEKSREEMLAALAENVKASYANACRAVEETGKKAFIAGDIGPILESGQGEREEQEAYLEEYYVIADALLEAGANIIWFETFSDFRYLLPVASYIKSKSQAFIMGSFCLNKFGYTRSGLSARGILKTAEESGCLDGVGFNCGIGSTHMYQVLKQLDLGNLVVSVIPNSGYPDTIKDRNGYQENIAYFSENMEKTAALGVDILGGCCGTTPSYIKNLAKAVPKIRPKRFRQEWESQESGGIQKEKNPFYRKLAGTQKIVVAELDPPHNGDCEKIVQASVLLKEAGVDLITFSDSPMGKMRADSMMTGAKIQREVELPVMPHVTCRDKNRLGLGASFFGAHMNGVRNLLLVTGDPVPKGDRSGITPVFDFNSIRLMEYLKQMNLEYFQEDPFVYGGALNYGRANLDKEIERMKEKQAAGADYFLTQPLFSKEDVERIAYIKEHIHAKILCGIMPLVSYRNASFMKNEVFGVQVPEEVVNRYQKDMSREEGEEVGIEIALELAEWTKNLGDGYYFMVPFNRASMICRIMKGMKERGLI